MQAFLKSVAEYLYLIHHSGVQEVCLVFPSRRAGVFFSRHLAQLIDKPIWMPQTRTISELMKELSGYNLADQLTLIFNLYQTYKTEKKTDESFDEFYYWGEMLLNDFDDIDKYLVDTKQLFQNIADLKDIEKQFTLPEEQMQIIAQFWKNVRLYETNSLKEDFISIWNVLQEIYNKFRALLHSRSVAYEGMMYRNICEQIISTGRLNTQYQHFAIIGFNALNNCEKQLFRYLQKNNLADFFWDYDNYYINNTWHEAGHFIRENLKVFPPPPSFKSNGNLTSPKNIEIIGVPSNIGQAKLISDILNRWNYKKDEKTETAVVLADEQLLIPVLSSIPEEIHDVNVTLGYPLRLTPIYSFFEALVTLHRNVKEISENQARFYNRDVVVLLNHPYVKLICEQDAEKLLDYIIRYNRIFLAPEELHKHEYLSQLFKTFKTSGEFINYFINIGAQTARSITKASNDNSSHFHTEYWLTFITALNRLNDLLLKENIVLEMPTLIKVLRKLTRGLSIPFKGEPLAGLQVMGMLETRALDFVNVIMLSTNEGVLPRSEAATSFIPYNLRKGFDLPTIEHQDAVYAYYFYRLIQRAANVAFLYNSQGNNGAAEMSRFLYQLNYEPVFKVKKRNLNFRVTLTEEKGLTIAKNNAILQALEQYTTHSTELRYLTPTAINAYLECSLRFYFRYIAKIKAQEQVVEDIEGAMFGKLLHSAMTQIYSPSLNEVMTTNDFELLIKDKKIIEDIIAKAFAFEFFKKEEETAQLHGNSLVVKEVLRKYILRILEIDRKYAPLTMLEAEKAFQCVLEIEVAGKRIPVKLGGTIDRIDKTNSSVRIIDYKTGKVSCKFESIEQLFETCGKKLNKEVLQILLYAYIAGESEDYKNISLLPGLYGMRDIFKNNFNYHVYQGKNETVTDFRMVKEKYLSALKGLLCEIFDPAVPFTKVADKKLCEYCDYKRICHRA